ncbi:MAG TPA: choice-of-anchor tandem repeat GloVer-containing protein, partial [Rhizomicrobium sp.]
MFRAVGKVSAAVSLAALAVAIGGAPCVGQSSAGQPGAAQPKKSAFNVIYNFAGSDGGSPFASLVQDAAGNSFGTTIAGGAGTGGTVFKLAPNGSETVLYAFTDGTDGGIPYSRLVQDQAGNLYGTTFSGGFHTCNCGVVFEISPSGQETVLHTFLGGTDGATPYSGLTFDKKGNLYGTTNAGGGACNCGTVYKIAPDGTETILHDFAGGSDGAFPFYNSQVTVDRRGNLYGVTY